jgi:hypothetical protein
MYLHRPVVPVDSCQAFGIACNLMDVAFWGDMLFLVDHRISPTEVVTTTHVGELCGTLEGYAVPVLYWRPSRLLKG